MSLAAAVCVLSLAAVGGAFELRTYTRPVYTAFAEKKCLNPVTIDTDPYDIGLPSPSAPESVCAVKYNDSERTWYSLETYNSVPEAERDGAHVTHGTQCGACSTLRDLSAFMEHTDLTNPVRSCMLKYVWSFERATQCIIDETGMTVPCAATFAYNGINTRWQCGGICMLVYMFGVPNNVPEDNRLNACLQCDEVNSGPVFKHFAGRTRRQSGLKSAIVRPSDEVFAVVHDYY
ncbi:hypothetical protein DIPPA_31505 [Diplonema papillatum]|nr:hypothetical protein DIPPA_31505 [Diplonema papillatum]|eukprot:gene3040-4774_t